MLESAILSTDLALYFKYVPQHPIDWIGIMLCFVVSCPIGRRVYSTTWWRTVSLHGIVNLTETFLGEWMADTYNIPILSLSLLPLHLHTQRYVDDCLWCGCNHQAMACSVESGRAGGQWVLWAGRCREKQPPYRAHCEFNRKWLKIMCFSQCCDVFQAMMDRQKKDELPKMQVGFINFICLPLYAVLTDLLPDLTPFLDGVNKNKTNWQSLADNPNGKFLLWSIHMHSQTSIHISA